MSPCRAAIEQARSAVGLDRIVLVHANDSKGQLSSRKDRHEHIGRGKISPMGFHRILTHERFSGLPMVLETPKDGEDEFEMDIRNLAELRKLAAKPPAES